jgi:hypothetical protein
MAGLEQIKFAKTTVWNFPRLASQRIKDQNLRKYLKKLLGSNRKYEKPIEGIGIISFDDCDNFIQSNDKQIKEIDELRKVLFLVAVAKSNIHSFRHAGHMMVTSENFNVIYQNFSIDSEYTAYQTGKIITTMSGGHKVGEIKYEIPRYVPKTNFNYDDEFLKALQLVKIRKPSFFRTIIRATDAMMNGYSNSDDVSYESRILEQSRAFEILFNLPERGQRKELKANIKKYCTLNSERKWRYKSERSKSNKVPETGTKHEMWADRFYTLRNHIIHGELVKNKDFVFSGQRHHDIGLWFFIASVKQMINEQLKKTIFIDTIRYEKAKFEYDRQPYKLLIEQVMRKMKITAT